MAFANKKNQVKRQLEQGEAVVVYDEKNETASIFPTHQLHLVLDRDGIKAVGF